MDDGCFYHSLGYDMHVFACLCVRVRLRVHLRRVRLFLVCSSAQAYGGMSARAMSR